MDHHRQSECEQRLRRRERAQRHDGSRGQRHLGRRALQHARDAPQPAGADFANKPKNGDPAALEQLLRRHQVWIYNIAERSALDTDRTWLYSLAISAMGFRFLAASFTARSTSAVTLTRVPARRPPH